jgi:hypothetical protein
MLSPSAPLRINSAKHLYCGVRDPSVTAERSLTPPRCSFGGDMILVLEKAMPLAWLQFLFHAVLVIITVNE